MLNKKHKILVIDEWIPLPANIGKKIRTINLLKELSKEYTIDLICFADAIREKDFIKEMSGFGINVIPVKIKRSKRGSLGYFFDLFLNQFSFLPFSVAYHYKKPFLLKLNEVIGNGNYKLLHFEWTQMSIYLKRLKIIQPIVVSAHNIEATLWLRYVKNHRNILKKLFYYLQMKKTQRFEKWAYNRVNCVTAVSENDAQAIREIYGQKNVIVVSNGVDLDNFKNSNTEIADNSLIYAGAMDYWANIDAVDFFIKDVIPILINKLPSLRFVVVGRNPKQRLLDLQRSLKYLEVTGTVEDVRPYYKKSSIFVVPLRCGAGTRLKILEAMAMEMPVVSTRIGAESLHYENEVNIMIADTPEQFCNKIVELSKSLHLKELLGIEGRKLVEKYYDWKQIAAKQGDLWYSLITIKK